MVLQVSHRRRWARLLRQRRHDDLGAGSRVSQTEHDARLGERSESGCTRDSHDASKTELQPEREHEENDAQLGERRDCVLVGDDGTGRCGPTIMPANK
jgi:hypothetical protein